MTTVLADSDGPPRPLNPLQVGSKDIVDWLLKQDPEAIGTYNSLSSQEYAKAFAVARSIGTDVITDIHSALIKSINEGGTFTDFANLVTPVLKQKGWLGGDEGEIASRLDLIFDTNISRAQTAGYWDRIQRNKRIFPYLRGVTAGDGRVRHPPTSRSDHRAWQDVVLPVDHWFWKKWGCGHLGFRCRCTVQQLLRSQAARYTITSEEEVVARDARLGTPIFPPQSAPIADQIDALTGGANSRRMPGLPATSTASAIADGQSLASIGLRQALTSALIVKLTSLGLPTPQVDSHATTTETVDDISGSFAAGSRLKPATKAALARLRARRAARG